MNFRPLLLSVTILSTSFSSVFASCLDRLPLTQKEINREYRIAKFEHQINLENKEMYQELAKDANHTKNLATLALTVGLAPGAAYLGLYGLTSGIYYSSSVLTMGSLGALIADGAFVVHSPYRLIKDYFAGEFDLPEHVRIPVGKCSYQKMQADLDEQISAVVEKKFNGSVRNMIIDHVTLGRLSSKATLKMLELSQLKTIISEAKVKELESLTH